MIMSKSDAVFNISNSEESNSSIELSHRQELEIAARLSQSRNFQVLEAFCQRALRKYPKDVDFLNFLGMAAVQQGHFAKAREAYLAAYQFADRKNKIHLLYYLQACLVDRDFKSAFTVMEEEFMDFSPAEQYQVLEDISVLIWNIPFDSMELKAWFSRNKIVQYSQYLGVFRWIRSHPF